MTKRPYRTARWTWFGRRKLISPAGGFDRILCSCLWTCSTDFDRYTWIYSVLRYSPAQERNTYDTRFAHALSAQCLPGYLGLTHVRADYIPLGVWHLAMMPHISCCVLSLNRIVSDELCVSTRQINSSSTANYLSACAAQMVISHGSPMEFQIAWRNVSRICPDSD